LHQVGKAILERHLRIENRRLQAEVNKTAVIEKLNRELNTKVNELTRLYTISEGLNSFMDNAALFEKIASLAAQVTGAQRVSVMLLDRSRRFLKIRSAIGVSSDEAARTVQPVGKGIAGKVAQTGKPIRMTQRAIDYKPVVDNDRINIYKSNSWLSLPLVIGQEVFGVINLTDKLDGSDFSREDEQIMQTLVEKAGTKLENQALYEGIYSNLIDTLNALVTSIEAKDPYTHDHSQRVTEYAMSIARIMGLGEDEVEMLNFAAMLHDIGKIGVRDDVLLKNGKLTNEEYDVIKLHPIVGERIVKPLGLVCEEVSIIRHHHERYDGNGYPDRLKGEDIPLLARIVAVADAFDAMTSTRAYRRALPIEAATNELIRCSGVQFDPKVVESMVSGLAQNIIIVPVPNVEPVCPVG
jgi:putative nucleotidyltransferase with HDIG domain